MKKSVTFALAGALLVTAGLAQAERSGEELYNTKCMVCHAAGVANAPKLGDKAAWEPRIAAADVDTMVATVKSGKNAMPPMGTCMDCSDGEFKAAIEYMLSKVQ